MQRLQAFKFELMPNGLQIRKMRQFAGMCRYVFNKALALQKENHEAGNKFLNYAALSKHLTAWRNCPETAWLSQGPVHTQQQTLKDLEKSYVNFFEKRAAFPRADSNLKCNTCHQVRFADAITSFVLVIPATSA